MVISGISKPKPGMFVLNLMHFSWWFQIWSWNSKILRNLYRVVCSRLPRGKCTLHDVIGFNIHTKSFCFSKFSKLFTFLNQYQTYLYSIQCISHGYSKYGHDISKCWSFSTFCEICIVSSAHACRMVSVNSIFTHIRQMEGKMEISKTAHFILLKWSEDLFHHFKICNNKKCTQRIGSKYRKRVN